MGVDNPDAVLSRKPVPVTVVILTYNEEIHIARAINNVRDWAVDVFVVDSYSNDQTCRIAEEAGAQVFPHKFENYAAQREWALRKLPYKTEWMLFLDADELLAEPLKEEISRVLAALPAEVAGFYIKRKFYWLGRWIKYGGIYPTWILRLMRHRAAHCNPREINEHLEVQGKTGHIEGDILHQDMKPISDWIAKHNRYAELEAMELIKAEQGAANDAMANLFGTQAERKRWIRQRIWNPLPPLVRPFLLFLYRYIVRFGFLDGQAGLAYHFLQGLWFPFLIDVKYLELRKNW